MNILWRILAVALMMGSAYAQSNLPACQGSEVSRWSNCSGAASYSNGDKYVGEFKDGKANGQGTYTYFYGTKYTGEFKDGLRNGYGTYTNLSGDKYVGEFKDDLRNGKGTLTPAYGNKHVGEWRDDQRNGQGTETYPNGDKYVGEFKEGRFNGQGTSYASNGSIISQGIWADGRFVRSAPVQQATTPNTEIDRLRTEAVEAKRKQAEAEEKMRVAEQQASQTRENERLRAEAEEAKRKQAELESQLRLAQQPTIQPTQQAISQPTSKRIALVVGNANYKVRPLKNPRNDADDISRSLRSSGFEVIDLRDATIQQMRSGVRQFGDKLLTHDVGLVYYSGHGVEVRSLRRLI